MRRESKQPDKSVPPIRFEKRHTEETPNQAYGLASADDSYGGSFADKNSHKSEVKKPQKAENGNANQKRPFLSRKKKDDK